MSSDGERVDRDDYARFQMLLAAGRTPSCVYRVSFLGMEFDPTAGRSWSTNSEGIARLISADRVVLAGKTINYVRFVGDNPTNPISKFVVRHGIGQWHGQDIRCSNLNKSY